MDKTKAKKIAQDAQAGIKKAMIAFWKLNDDLRMSYGLRYHDIAAYFDLTPRDYEALIQDCEEYMER